MLGMIFSAMLSCQSQELRGGLIEAVHQHHRLFALDEDTFTIKTCKVFHPPKDTYFEGTFPYTRQINKQYDSYRKVWIGECHLTYRLAHQPTRNESLEKDYLVRFIYLPEDMSWGYLSKELTV